MRSEPDADACAPEPLDLFQVRGDRCLAEPFEPAARIRDVEDDELDADCMRGVDRCERLR